MASSTSCISFTNQKTCIHVPKKTKSHIKQKLPCNICSGLTIAANISEEIKSLLLSPLSIDSLIISLNNCQTTPDALPRRNSIKKSLALKLKFICKLYFVNEDNVEYFLSVIKNEFLKRDNALYRIHLSDCVGTHTIEAFLKTLKETNPAYLIRMISAISQQEHTYYYEPENLPLFLALLEMNLCHYSKMTELAFSPSLLSMEFSSLLKKAFDCDQELGLKLLKMAKKKCLRITTSTLSSILKDSLEKYRENTTNKIIKLLIKHALKTHNVLLLHKIKTQITKYEHKKLIQQIIETKIIKQRTKQIKLQTAYSMQHISYLEKEAMSEQSYYKLKTLKAFQSFMQTNHS